MQKILFGLCFLFISTLSYANEYGLMQSIETNVAVYDHSKQNYFQVMFRSNQFFDTYHKSQLVKNGNSFARHDYKNGPVNIKIEVGMANENNAALIIPRQNCEFLSRRGNTWFETNYTEVNKKITQWIFTFTETASFADFTDVYYMDCSIYAAQ